LKIAFVTKSESVYMVSLDDTSYTWVCPLGQPCIQLIYSTMFMYQTDKCNKPKRGNCQAPCEPDIDHSPTGYTL